MDEPLSLEAIRKRIDAVDLRIHELLDERAEYAQPVGRSKRSAGLITVDFYRPEREAPVLRQAVVRNKGARCLDGFRVHTWKG